MGALIFNVLGFLISSSLAVLNLWAGYDVAAVICAMGAGISMGMTIWCAVMVWERR